MRPQRIVLIAVSVAACGLAACAGPRAIEAPATGAAPASPAGPPAAPALPELALDEPAIVAVTKALAGAAAPERPPLLIARAREAVAAAQRIRGAQGIAFGGATPGYEKYVALYGLAQGDLGEVADRHPATPEAPEARFLLGLVNDYPHLEAFEEAVRHYLLTIEKYPGTVWAQRAGDRVRRLDAIRDGGGAPAR